MVRIRETSFRSDCQPSQGQDHGCHEHNCDLDPNVQSEGPSAILVVETCDEDCGGDGEEKSDDGHDAMRCYDLVVVRLIAKSVPHAYRPVSSPFSCGRGEMHVNIPL